MGIEVLSETEMIVQHLEDLIQEQIRLQVRFEGDRGEYLTQPMGFLSPTNKILILLDALAPGEGQIKAEINNRLICEYRWQNETCGFIAEIDHLVEEPREGVVIKVPTEIAPLQKRRHFRVEPSLGNPIRFLSFSIEDYPGSPERHATRCIVVDVSAGGISFNTDIPRASLEPGTVINEAELEIPEIGGLVIDLVVRSARSTKSGKYKHRVGAEFLVDDDATREIINRYVTNKQREDIRRYNRELD